MSDKLTSATNSEFPGLRSIFSESWQLLSQNILNLLGLAVISLVANLFLVATFVGLSFFYSQLKHLSN